MRNPEINNMYVLLRQRPIVGPLNIYGLLALAGILGPPVLIIASYTAAFTTPGYNIIRDSISSLALTRMGWLQTVGFLTIGTLVEIYVVGLLFNIGPRRGFQLSAVLLLFVGFLLLMTGAFHTSAAGAAPTIEETIHGIASKTVFVIFPVAVWFISFSIKHDPRWRYLFLYTMVTVILGFLLILAAYLAINTNWFGLFERLLVWNMVIWVEVTAVRLLRLSLCGQHETVNVSSALKPKERD
jgi:hypothetical protein